MKIGKPIEAGKSPGKPKDAREQPVFWPHQESPPPPIYPLTCPLSGDHIGLASQLLEAGAGWLQIRDKTQISDRELLRQIETIRRSAGARGATLIVNDRVDLAQLAKVGGVHLGQQDLPAGRVRSLFGKDWIIGLSTHNLQQFKEACRLPVDYIAVGPVFSTSTNQSAYPPLGLSFLEKVRALTHRPLVAIGGINLQRAQRVWRVGIDSVAVVSDIVQHESPGRRLRQYIELAKETI